MWKANEMGLRTIVLAVSTALLLLVQNNLALAGIGVTPSKIQLSIDPGGKGGAELYIANDSSDELQVTSSVWDFARDRHGRPFPIRPEETKTFRGCANWVTFDSKSLALSPRQIGKIQINVQVPPKTDLGTYYTYVQILSTPSQTKKDILVRSKINALLLVTVGMPTDVSYLEQALQVDGITVKKVNFTEPISLAPTVENKGNYHLNLEGNIQIKQGKKIIKEIPVKEYTLLPDAKLQISKIWDNPPILGKFTALFTGKAQGLNKTITASNSFWVIPGKLAIIAALSIIIVLIAALLLRRKYKRRRPAKS